MKKLLTLFALNLFIVSITFGQISQRGNFLIGGTLGFSTATSSVEQVSGDNVFKGEGTQATQFNIAPNIGYFFANNFALGLGLDYTLNKTSEPIDFTDPNTTYLETYDSDLLFGPFARYYIPLQNSKAFFFETTFGFGSSYDEFQTEAGTQTTATNVFAVGVGPGFSIISGDAIGIEALVKYNYARSNSDIDIDAITTEITSATNQLDFSVGLQFYFSRVRPAR